jgi:hypothetical protein
MQDDLNRRQAGMSRNTMMAIAAIVAVLVIGFLWAPWNSPRVADNAPGTTVGSTTRPVAPVAPTAPAPDTPAAPSTNR